MTLNLIGAVLGVAVLMGGTALPAYAGGNCGEKAAAMQKEIEGNTTAVQAKISNALTLIEKAKKLNAAGKKRGCFKLVERARQVLNDE